jgi:hypothetical protein
VDAVALVIEGTAGGGTLVVVSRVEELAVVAINVGVATLLELETAVDEAVADDVAKEVVGVAAEVVGAANPTFDVSILARFDCEDGWLRVALPGSVFRTTLVVGDEADKVDDEDELVEVE